MAPCLLPKYAEQNRAGCDQLLGVQARPAHGTSHPIPDVGPKSPVKQIRPFVSRE